MKKIISSLMILAGCLILTASLHSEAKGMENAFPQMKGWEKKEPPAIYTPDNLYEYINGAADVFLSYDFQKLAAVSFENKDKASFTMDIYLHNNTKNGFGIYSQEKPQKGPFIPIGTQGYYEKGVLNFLKGSYYVKISGYDLGDNDEAVLTEAAKQTAQKLDGQNHFPKAVQSFPEEGKIQNSERYIAQNFLGHSFLHSAFVADYDNNGRKIEVFIIETENETGTKKILDGYLKFIAGKGIKAENPGKDFYRFQDPYYRSSGTMYMKRNGNYLWGLFCKNPALADTYIKKIEGKLAKSRLITK
ncbi:MAG: hypothetical protein GY950_28610 [bacterium]|nr:hypothetical protein [bacterium]